MAIPANLSTLLPAGYQLTSDTPIEILTTENRIFWGADGVQPALGTWLVSIVTTEPQLFSRDGVVQGWYRFAVMWVSATGALLRVVQLGWLTNLVDGFLAGGAFTIDEEDLGTPVTPVVDPPAGEPEEPEPEEPAETVIISTGTLPPGPRDGNLGLAFLLGLALKAAG